MGKPELKRPELIAPAGDLERLKTAIHFGADAVYLSGKNYSLRNFSKNFTIPELSDAVCYVHDQNRRVYLAINSFLRNEDLNPFEEFLDRISSFGFDALILSDPAALEICRKKAPHIPLHLSTQTNTLNMLSSRFWFSQGISRIILARELSLEELIAIKKNSPGEIEIFVHGAMCMAYSGRCLLSRYLAQRDANQGLCTQSCRWEYALSEAKRPGAYFPIEEEEEGTYILNSKDLCLITCLPELIQSGIDAFKIEGRMKGIHYLATVIKAYRWAIDSYLEAPDQYRLSNDCLRELEKISHREYTTGFLLGEEGETICDGKDRSAQLHPPAGLIKEQIDDQWFEIEVLGPIKKGDSLERIGRGYPNPVFTIKAMKTAEGHDCPEAHGGTRISMYIPVKACPGDLLRNKT